MSGENSMNMDLFTLGAEEARPEVIPPAQAVSLAAAGAPVTQGPVHVAVPVVPAPAAAQPIEGPSAPSEASAEPKCFAPPLPSLERVRGVLVQHGVLALDSDAELHSGIVPALAQLVAEAQGAPAGLPQAAQVLAWVPHSQLQRFAPWRVIRALEPHAVANGERMYPLCGPATPRKTTEQ